MKILAIEHEVDGVKAEEFLPHLKPEAARVWELYQSDIIREMYFDKERHCAVMVLECADTKSAEEILKTLPLVKARLIKFEFAALIPYPGFERLFK
jgi:hypothetical protein